METVKAAAVQAAPVFLDRDATTDKACTLIEKAAGEGAGLVVFPETFIPTYPDWVWRTTPFSAQSADLFGRLFEQSVIIPSPTTDTLGEAAARAGAWVCIGVNEREEHGSTLYNTQLYFSPDGALAAAHRKLVPTGGERLVWGMGDGSTLEVIDTPFGRLGGLTCWENYMPLARAALYAKGIEIYLAPTWDNSSVWVASMQHIAKEGRMFVVGVNFCMKGSDVPAGVPHRDELYGGADDWLSKGNSVIVGPQGNILAGPLVGEEGIIYADLDAAEAHRARHEFDVVGHYSRADVLQLHVNTDAVRAVTFDKRPIGGEDQPAN
jgi:nitrilase